MALTPVNENDLAVASQIQQIIDVLNGTTGEGQPVRLTALSSNTVPALTLQNQGSGGILEAYDTDDNLVFSIDDSGTWTQGHLAIGEEELPHPETLLQIAGDLDHDGGDLYGIDLESTFIPSTPSTEAHALFVGPQVEGTNGATTNTMTFYAGVGVALWINSSYDANIGDVYGFYVSKLVNQGSGTITDQFGYWSNIDHPDAATNNWAFYGAGTAPSYFGGSVTVNNGLIMTQIASPGDPGASKVALYGKTDDKLYFHPDGGSELTVATTSTAMVQLAKTTLGSNTATVEFASISQSYSALRIGIFARSTRNNTVDTISMQFAPQATGTIDTGANYDTQGLYGGNTTASAEQTLLTTFIFPGYIPALNAPSNESGCVMIDIPSYATTTFEKVSISTGFYRDGTAAGDHFTTVYGGHWNNTAAIGGIRFTNALEFATGSVFVLWGIP